MPSNQSIDRGIDVLADMIINSKFDTEQIEKENCNNRRNKNVSDSSEDYLYDELLMRTFDNRGVGRNVLELKSPAQKSIEKK